MSTPVSGNSVCENPEGGMSSVCLKKRQRSEWPGETNEGETAERTQRAGGARPVTSARTLTCGVCKFHSQ